MADYAIISGKREYLNHLPQVGSLCNSVSGDTDHVDYFVDLTGSIATAPALKLRPSGVQALVSPTDLSIYYTPLSKIVVFEIINISKLSISASIKHLKCVVQEISCRNESVYVKCNADARDSQLGSPANHELHLVCCFAI